MDFFENFWDVILWSLWFFFVIAFIMLLIRIFTDIFSDKSIGGGAKTLWILFVVFLPFLGSLIYLIARGQSMAERQMKQMAQAKAAQDEYIRTVATSAATPAEQIASAKQLLDSGAISQAEFDSLKAKALA